jgi:hypothetical protein
MVTAFIRPVMAGRLVTGYSRGCVCGQVITADTETLLSRAWCTHQIKHGETA